VTGLELSKKTWEINHMKILESEKMVSCVLNVKLQRCCSANLQVHVCCWIRIKVLELLKFWLKGSLP